MVLASIYSVLRLLYPLFAVLVMLTSTNATAHFNEAAYSEVRVPSISEYVLESTTQSSQVPTTLIIQGCTHICFINVPPEETDLGKQMLYSELAYAIYQQATVASVYRSPDTPPPR